MTDAQKAEARRNALALRIWRHCEPIGWNCTVVECAEAIGVPWRRVYSVVKAKDWYTRFRALSYRYIGPIQSGVHSAQAPSSPYRLTSANDRETYDW